ncbi:MAG: hypothetical protein ACW98X_25000 [Promethearchaeota archaeon]|jgi:hypothetical protein
MSEDNKKTQRTILPFKPSTIETIDFAVYDWVNEKLNAFATTNKGFKKVPVVWVAAERAFQIKHNKDLRDDDGALIFPIIAINRTGMVKDLSKKGMFYGNIDPKSADPVNGYYKGGSIQVARRIQQDKTATFINAKSARKSNQIVGNGQINFPGRNPKNKAVFEEMSVPMPVYVDVSYTINIRTEYQQQMNEIIQPFLTKTNGVNYDVIKRDNHQYELFIQGDISLNNNITEINEETRVYQTAITFKVLGHLIGEGTNQETPNVVVRETAIEVATPRERSVVESDLPWIHGKLPR